MRWAYAYLSLIMVLVQSEVNALKILIANIRLNSVVLEVQVRISIGVNLI